MFFVNIRNVKPTSPGIRWRKKIMFNKFSKKKWKIFTIVKKWHSGRTISGRIAFRQFMKRKFKKKIILNWVKIDIRTSFVSQYYLFNFNNRKPYIFFWIKGGGSFIMPAVTTNQPGKLYISSNTKIPTFKCFLTGIPVNILLIPFYMRVCNIVIKPFFKYKYATASGVFAIKIRAPKREKNIKLIMPSGQFKLINSLSLVIAGLTIQYWLHKQVYGKAGLLRQHGKKQKVRGIAMNSIDHPHGGKANSVQPEKSPWGWITKKSH